MNRKFTVLFNVINREDAIRTGCSKSLFVTDNNYNVGQHFVHHYYNVECVVTKVETNR